MPPPTKEKVVEKCSSRAKLSEATILVAAPARFKRLYRSFACKLCYSYVYDPCRSYLTIRMPSPLHDVFCAKIVEEISRQLNQFAQREKPYANFAKEVEHLATSRIMIPNETRDRKQIYSKRELDASFKHRRSRYPGVIIERPEYTTLDSAEELQATSIVKALPRNSHRGSLVSIKKSLLHRDSFVTFFHAPKKNSEGRRYCRALSIVYARELESVVGLKLLQNSPLGIGRIS
ncbi:hypothetical protein N7534_008514 [Penicillium rubens]|nr:hypothetical protein N7534_008514 [Penicillium rubens]